MSVALNKEGAVLAETKEGVTMPADFTLDTHTYTLTH